MHISRNRTIFRYAPNETGGTAKNPIKTGSLSQRQARQDRAAVVQSTCNKCMNECGCSAAGQRARNNTKLSKLIAAGASELVDVQEEALGMWVIPCQINKFLANFQLNHHRF